MSPRYPGHLQPRSCPLPPPDGREETSDPKNPDPRDGLVFLSAFAFYPKRRRIVRGGRRKERITAAAETGSIASASNDDAASVTVAMGAVHLSPGASRHIHTHPTAGCTQRLASRPGLHAGTGPSREH